MIQCLWYTLQHGSGPGGKVRALCSAKSLNRGWPASPIKATITARLQRLDNRSRVPDMNCLKRGKPSRYARLCQHMATLDSSMDDDQNGVVFIKPSGRCWALRHHGSPKSLPPQINHEDPYRSALVDFHLRVQAGGRQSQYDARKLDQLYGACIITLSRLPIGPKCRQSFHIIRGNG